jgi:hypothetical protein
MAIGKGIAEQLARWRKGLKPGPAVPFEPAPRQPAPVTAAQHP